jgi:hypothetical protein
LTAKRRFRHAGECDGGNPSLVYLCFDRHSTRYSAEIVAS